MSESSFVEARDSQETPEGKEISVSESPFPLEELEKLGEEKPELKEWAQNVKNAAFTYDSDIGRVSQLRLKRERTKEENDRLNELTILARLSLNTLEDSINILSRRCVEAGADNEWRRKFFSPLDIADWAIRAAANLKRQASKEIHKGSE